jgi:CheY-like chemotaxis protein
LYIEEGMRYDVRASSSIDESTDGTVTHLKGRVLILDDEVSIRTLIGKMLKRIGVETSAVADGRDALTRYEEARAEGRPFDLVIVDLTIPGGMGGRETFERLRLSDPSVKVLATSGYSEDPVVVEPRKHGFVGFVGKPFHLEELHSAVADALAD